jgi:ComF family protein
LFKILGNSCEICSIAIPQSTFKLCGSCIKNKPCFDRVFTRYFYEEPLRTVLHEFKYKNGLYLRKFMVQLLLNALPDQIYKPDCLIPVPMHPLKLRQRGFNQSVELTKLLAKRLGVAYNLKLCTKKLITTPQTQLNRKQRIKNLKHAFSVDNTEHTHITLVDDLLTTGSTANAIARLLKKQGVQRVDVLCCARTP